MFDHNGDHMKKSHRGVAKFGIALGLGPRDFAGSNPVTPTKKLDCCLMKTAILFYFDIVEFIKTW